MATEAAIVRARDLMQSDYVAVAPHTPLLSVHRLFVDLRIHGAPVVDSHDEVVGVVSALDLLRTIRAELEPGRTPSTSTYFWDEATDSIDHTDIPEGDALWRLIVRDAMTKTVISVDPDLPVEDVARVMVERRIHRVLVMSGKRLLGVISTFDLLGAVAHRTTVGAHVEHIGYSR
jgi:CBS domain-containing protein